MKHPGWPGVVAALVLPVLASLVSAADAGPRVHFQSTSVDYGKVPVEQRVEHRFRFENVGDAPLRITNRFCHANFIMAKALEGC